MELEAKRRHLPFLTANARLNSRFGVVMDEDTFIEKAYYIWRRIGNIATQTSRVTRTVPANGIVLLPAGVEFVKSVTSVDPGSDLGSEHRHTSNGTQSELTPDAASLSDEMANRASINYASGESVNFIMGPNNDNIRFTSKSIAESTVLIVYSSIDTDPDGLPLLNDREVEAISASMALQQAESDMFLGKPGADKKLAYMAPLADKLMASAAISEKISENCLDKMLDIKTSWNRKSFGDKFNWSL